MPDKLAQLKGILEIIRQDTVSAADFNVAFKALAQVIKDAISETKGVAQENKLVLLQALEALKEDKTKYSNELRKEIESFVTKNLNEIKKDNQEVLNQALEALNKISQIQVRDGIDGKDAKPEDVVPLVLAQLPKDEPETPEQLRDKLETLEGQERLDAKAIKNLPEFTDKRIIANNRSLAFFDETTLVVDNPTKIKFQGSGVQISLDSEGSLIVTVAGGAGSITFEDESLVDSGDHTSFTISFTPSAGTLLVINENTGQIVPSSLYSQVAATITFTSNQQIDDGAGNLVTPTFRARYSH